MTWLVRKSTTDAALQNFTFGSRQGRSDLVQRNDVSSPPPTTLPYTDTKPVGAGGFYTAINATFRFIERKLGRDGLLRYWRELGCQYYAPVTQRWRAGGLKAVASYWRDFFRAEPGGEVEVEEGETEVCVSVKVCPIIRHLREQQREVFPDFCQHCYFVSEAMAGPAGLTVRVKGGNGACIQRFLFSGHDAVPQQMDDISRCTSLL